jgi:radical SAM superfamily enzyme YgiQ (UPF0313 family)
MEPAKPKLTFLEPPPVTKKTPERLAGCSYELYHMPDLGNLYAFTWLDQKGYPVGYLDAVSDRLTAQAFLDWVARDDSDLYVIHSVVLAKEGDLHFIPKILAARPAARILVHGPEPTRVPEEYLIDPRVIVFRGELEKSLLEYLETGDSPGVSLRENGRAVHRPPRRDLVSIDELPIPRRDHPALTRYLKGYHNPKLRRRPQTVMLASRGCAYHCNYCVPLSTSFASEMEQRNSFGRKPPQRFGSPERVIAEFREIQRLGYRAVMVLDDQFLSRDTDRTLAICDGIAELDLEWGMLSRADLLLDPKVVRALRRAGCVSIDIGVENFNQRTLDSMRKGMDVEDVYRALALLREVGIQPKVNIMFGTDPQETFEEMEQTVATLKQLKIDNVMFAVATPFKGTPFYDRVKAAGYLKDDTDKINPIGKAVIEYPHLTSAELTAYVNRVYRRFYLRPEWIWRRVCSYRSPLDLVHDVQNAIKLFKPAD